jgi:hypothetical protein
MKSGGFGGFGGFVLARRGKMAEKENVVEKESGKESGKEKCHFTCMGLAKPPKPPKPPPLSAEAFPISLCIFG